MADAKSMQVLAGPPEQRTTLCFMGAAPCSLSSLGVKTNEPAQGLYVSGRADEFGLYMCFCAIILYLSVKTCDKQLQVT